MTKATTDSTPRQSNQLQRTTFKTSRLLDFCGVKELTRQTAHEPALWPAVIVKELTDNALDACEETNTPPEITIDVTDSEISVVDNGPGIPEQVIDSVLDFSIRTSSREAYVSPSRGQQGNAMPSIIAMPFALDGEKGQVDIGTRGKWHKIVFSVDPIVQRPVITKEVAEDALVKNGTKIIVHWPPDSSSLLAGARHQILQLADGFAIFNPHAAVFCSVDGDGQYGASATNELWEKWLPSMPTTASWYRPEDFERLLAAYISHDRERGTNRSVREVVAEFRGLAGTAKQKTILAATGLARQNLDSLLNGNGFRKDVVGELLTAMQSLSQPVKPRALGVIGEHHFRTQFEELYHVGDMETFRYRRTFGETEDGLPFVVEAAFAPFEDSECVRKLIVGANWSPALRNPFRELTETYDGGLEGVLGKQEVDCDAPVIVAIHVACPRLDYTDRGKSTIAVGPALGWAIKDALEKVTDTWAKTIRAEQRDSRRRARREEELKKKAAAGRLTVKEAAFRVMRDAYMHASSNNTLPTKARQVMYARRGEILRLTGKAKLNSRYFSQVLVPQYIEEHPEETADWDVIYDSRGTLIEPHTGRHVPLGTAEVRRYLANLGVQIDSDLSFMQFPTTIETCGPKHRFGGLFLVEKEGFHELFSKARLVERYDIAMMSTKGLSTTAARMLVEQLCNRFDIPLFVLHDLDKAGLSILNTLQSDTRRYQFTKNFRVIDLGLRLPDVQKWKLQSEEVCYGTGKGSRGHRAIDPEENLRQNGASDEEVEFLRGQRTPGGFVGQRVELNAFRSADLIAFIEGKLAENGVQKVVPEEEVLQQSFRQAFKITRLNREIQSLIDKVELFSADMKVPADLTALIREKLADQPAAAWDEVISAMAAQALDEEQF